MNNDKLPTICNDWLRTRDNWRLNLQTVTKYQRSDFYIYFSLVGLPDVSVVCDSSEAADDLLAMLDRHFSPAPVDDKALAFAVDTLEAYSIDTYYFGQPVRLVMKQVLDALRAAQQEVAELRSRLNQIATHHEDQARLWASIGDDDNDKYHTECANKARATSKEKEST